MTIFGIRIMSETDYQHETAVARNLLAFAENVAEHWKAKYYYAKARAVVAEQFQRKTIITARPKGGRVGVELEVGIQSETEIREL